MAYAIAALAGVVIMTTGGFLGWWLGYSSGCRDTERRCTLEWYEHRLARRRFQLEGSDDRPDLVS